MNFISKSLMRTVPVNVILPVDKILMDRERKNDRRLYKTLYLLHGIYGNYTDWISGTNIQRWAEEKDLAVVMPSGDNMFYVDQKAGHNYYGEFIGRELVEMMRKTFPLSEKKEDTFIAGLSMGGYGAIRNGLKYHETFGFIAGLSSALLIDELENRTNEPELFMDRRDFAESVYGDLTKVKNSDKNPKWLLEKLVEDKRELPEFYLACGTEDSLLGVNRDFRDLLNSVGAHLTYEEGPGGHEWDFWNRYIKKVIDWLPLEKEAAAGLNSGNVGM